MIDVVVTERGIAINPLRKDLLDAVQGSKLPIRPIQDFVAHFVALRISDFGTSGFILTSPS